MVVLGLTGDQISQDGYNYLFSNSDDGTTVISYRYLAKPGRPAARANSLEEYCA